MYRIYTYSGGSLTKLPSLRDVKRKCDSFLEAYNGIQTLKQRPRYNQLQYVIVKYPDTETLGQDRIVYIS